MPTTGHCRNCGHLIEHPLPQLPPDAQLCPRCYTSLTGTRHQPGTDHEDPPVDGHPPLDDADRYMSFGR